MHPSLTIYQNEVHNFISADFEIRLLAGDCLFTEGPVWNREGYYLFSDIPANCIYKIDEAGKKSVFLNNSGTDDPQDDEINQQQAGSNGLAYGLNGELLVCRHGNHSLSAYDGQELKTLVNAFGGRSLNSPNDLIVHSNGAIYFSDPPYGLKDGKLNPAKFQDTAAVYCYREGEVSVVSEKFQYPNGVCLSPDEKQLYICSNKPFEKFILLYDVASHHFIRVFAEENSDGIEIDAHGNIYLCSKEGIIILNSKGERMALIPLPFIPANACWGGQQGKDLFITARSSVFLIKDLLK